jgi:hypothetical protein
MEIANVFTDAWDEEQEHEGFRIREAQLGPRLGAELVGGERVRDRSWQEALGRRVVGATR